MSKADELLNNAEEAQKAFMSFSQSAVDKIVKAVYQAALSERVSLAKLAFEETGLGVWQDKVIKNVMASQLVYDSLQHQRTVGIVNDDPISGIKELACPVGPLLGLIPVTNPTATVIFKSLITLKSRNPLIISPHAAAKRCTVKAAEICYEAALKAGAPKNCIQWLAKGSPKASGELMEHPRLALILATGTEALVRKARVSGTPVIGVGPGNVPVYLGATADRSFAIKSILLSKTFDNGTVCAGEQAIVVKKLCAKECKAELENQGAYFMKPDEIEALGKVAFDKERGLMNAAVVGQSVEKIADMAGFKAPAGSRVLIGEINGVGPDYPLSAEILAPILAYYVEHDFDEAIERCSEITNYGGRGHTAVIYSNTEERVEYFSKAINAGRILVNTPATQGALGGMFNSLTTSFTLACGTSGKNNTTDNITATNLINIHRISRRRPNPMWTGINHELFTDSSLSAEELAKRYYQNF